LGIKVLINFYEWADEYSAPQLNASTLEAVRNNHTHYNQNKVTKYQTLLNILDKIRFEASQKYLPKYNPVDTDFEKINQARARTFIHLYLKVSFGLLDFDEREHYITDGPYDGGIDGYYISKENRIIYFIQSKFRTTESNFEGKEIKLEEILVMDINRVLDGDPLDELGNEYNGKIRQLIREIAALENIARYSYRVIILASLSKLPDGKLRQLTGGFVTEIFDYEKCYKKLIFPIISGTYFNASDLNINIDLSNKNAGSKISYTVQTKKGECEITVLFAPTIELGRIMYKYKNSILKFNPRSYLDFEGKKVNNAIRETIISKETNEFALFNNGITMLSDETFISEKIGQKNKAQLIVKNPQIINGGQTSFTLSRIYQEHLSDAEKIFANKEVLVKIITLLDKSDDINKIELIEEISTATNQQTPVIGADRVSNEKIHVQLQIILFDRYGLLYERKRGEFGDGLYNNYIQIGQIIERNLFFKNYYAANGQILLSRQKKLFLKQQFNEDTLDDYDKLDNFYFGYLSSEKLYKKTSAFQKIETSLNAKIYAFTKLYKQGPIESFKAVIDVNIDDFQERWKMFINEAYKTPNYDKKKKDKLTGEITTIRSFNILKWYESDEFLVQLNQYFGV
jgi:hypothetical protein